MQLVVLSITFKSGFTNTPSNYVFDRYVDGGLVLLSEDGVYSKTIEFAETPYEINITDELVGVASSPGDSLCVFV
jgi:hypothetical protein